MTQVDYASAAFLICDVWDTHWCRGATAAGHELALQIEDVATRLRDLGALIIHSPSDALDSYQGTPQRERAKKVRQREPVAAFDLDEPALDIGTPERWCRDDPPCEKPEGPPWPWTKQDDAITIGPDDVISDDGVEIYSLLNEHDRSVLIYSGVHTDICVLDRSFGIRQMRRWGVPCLLARDLTEAFWPERTPAVIEHIERHLCPTLVLAS